MTEDLKTDYKDDVLMPSEHGKRTFNIVDNDGNIVIENVHFEDVSNYLQVGDEYGNDVINEQNARINLLSKGTGMVFDSYQDYLDAYDDGDVPVGAMVYIKDSENQTITALQVTYNNSTVKSALDALVDGTAIKTHSAKTGSGSTVTNTIAENTSLDNAVETLLNNDYAINTKATRGTSYPKVYTASGQIATASGDNMKGNGIATVVLYASGIAVVYYEYLVVTAGTSGSVWAAGLSATALKQINANIPTITPIQGGPMTFLNPRSGGNWGLFGDGINGYAGINCANSSWWTVGRNYNGAAIGSHPASIFSLDTRVKGVAFGTFTPT